MKKSKEISKRADSTPIQSVYDSNSTGTYSDQERCVCCRRDVPISRDVDICERRCYIEGAGQLCRDCYDEIYRREY